MANARALALKGMKFADMGCRVLDFKSDVIGAAMKRARAAQKAVVKVRQTAEEFADTAARAVKKHPMKSVCCTFGTAFTIGAMAGWFARRRT